ncbi:MAG: DUF1080 domain-containing protein [Candidatus Binatia bacterium]|nr:DUF1080 domain-containing protein [Candidatus Binatia bacterium]MDG2009322.1 DUF1080 domain-containing protein [Candidatus Binatia bacterium]
MRWVKRIAVTLIGLIFLAVFVPWIGFQVWLADQPPRTQATLKASLGSFTAEQQFVLIQEFFFPTELVDHGDFGRKEAVGRGHAPWAFRTSLDGRPRILNLALAPEIWLSYSTESATIHQFWQGGIHLEGAVYDAQHGREPRSFGDRWIAPSALGWELRTDQGWLPARVHWLGWGTDPRTGRAWLSFQLAGPDGQALHLRESPEISREDDGSIALERVFERTSAPGPDVRLALPAGALRTSIDGQGSVNDSFLLLRGDGPAIGKTVRQVFDAPRQPIETSAQETSLPPSPFVRHGCQSCHHEKEQIVGPSWRAVSDRYREDPRDRVALLDDLSRRVIEGGVGRWGQVPMQPHPQLSSTEAKALVNEILSYAAAEESLEDGAEWTIGFPTEPRPQELHPALARTQIRPESFTPQTGGLALLPDGTLILTTWDRDGAVYAIQGWQKQSSDVRVRRIAEGLHEPLGVATIEDRIFVMQKQELTELVDRDGDGWMEEHRNLSADWGASSNFHEFGFGLAVIDGELYAGLGTCVLAGGDACPDQHPDRGKIVRISPDTGNREFFARGFRTPNGIATSPTGQLLVTDNQGSWLPASKLMEVGRGDDFGWRAPADASPDRPVHPPALWLPQNEIGNSPTQPLVLTQGPYEGHILFGDIFNGGIKRGFLETVAGQRQGAAFHFSGGLAAPVNRMIEAPDGTILVGEIGSRGNWGLADKPFFGLEALRFDQGTAFEPLEIRATPEGYRIVFSEPVDGNPTPEMFRLHQWSYRPDQFYGGPKFGKIALPVTEAVLSPDRRTVALTVEGRLPGTVVYIHIDRALESTSGLPLWINEAWYTQNALPPSDDPQPNQLSPEEMREGWRLLFNGKTFDGWKIYGAEDDQIEGWAIENGTLAFTRTVSTAGMIWNHINPFTRGALDLMTKEKFSNFELVIDWKIEPGGNSGVFFAIPDESGYLAWTYGLEMQLLDDDGHADGQIEKHRAGDLYDLQASPVRAAGPPGTWNQSRIRVAGDRIQQWLNGKETVDIIRGSPIWDQAVADSKFADTEGFGRAQSGHIALQDHGDRVLFRNIKIRELP